MKTTCLLALAGLLLTGCVTKPPPIATKPTGPSLAEIQAMMQAQVGDAVIVSQIQNSSTCYVLTADQIIALKSAGVSDTVVSALINTASKPPIQTPAVTYYDPWPWRWDPYCYGGYYPVYRQGGRPRPKN